MAPGAPITARELNRATLARQHRSAVFSRNADVLPTFLLDGMVAGTWQLAREGTTARLSLVPFGPIPPAERDALLVEADRVLSLLPAVAERAVRLAS